ncbi:hypothetical protein BDQ17DRAFT_1428492 [Cyathus striatus]|nr:hypothetical protein BDQ17DRAFT_1428492 [Cyathus striatus]
MSTDHRANLSLLFPPPSIAPFSQLSAVNWPGATAESTEALLEVLKDNHERWHVFFTKKKYHSHVAHRSLAMYALGVEGSVIKNMYANDSVYLKEAFDSPGEITEHNFVDHLGDDRYYTGYLHFFTYYVLHKGVGITLEEFIFSRKYNISSDAPTLSNAPLPASSKQKKAPAVEILQHLEQEYEARNSEEIKKEEPHMLSRFLSGLIHPFIHTAHGIEFGLPGLVVEGLAQAAVTEDQCTPLLPKLLFESESESQFASGLNIDTDKESFTLHSSLNEVRLVDPTSNAKPVAMKVLSSDGREPQNNEAKINSTEGEKRGHALTILQRILSSSTIVPPKGLKDEREIFVWTISNHGEAIASIVSKWNPDTNTSSGTRKAIEEIVWVACLVYGVGGWTGRDKVNGVFNADFYLVHLVTSSLFLPALLFPLPPSSRRAFLLGYLSTSMVWYTARGKPNLDIHGFFSSSPLSSQEDEAPNRWIPLFTPSITHSEEHVLKAVRALAHWGGLYGTKPRGFLCEVEEVEFDGKEAVDGTLFVRVAELTVMRMARDGKGRRLFGDMLGFYE